MWCLSVHPLPLPRVHSRRGGEITPRAGREGGWEWGMGMRKGGFGGCEASVREVRLWLLSIVVVAIVVEKRCVGRPIDPRMGTSARVPAPLRGPPSRREPH